MPLLKITVQIRISMHNVCLIDTRRRFLSNVPGRLASSATLHNVQNASIKCVHFRLVDNVNWMRQRRGVPRKLRVYTPVSIRPTLPCVSPRAKLSHLPLLPPLPRGLSERFSNTRPYIRPRVTLRVARKAIRVTRDIPRSLSPVIQLSRMDAASVRRSSGVSSITTRGAHTRAAHTANIIYHKLLKSRTNIHDASFRLRNIIWHCIWRARPIIVIIDSLPSPSPWRWRHAPWESVTSEPFFFFLRIARVRFRDALRQKISFGGDKREWKDECVVFSYSDKFAFWNFSHVRAQAFPLPTKETALGPYAV